MKALDIPDSVRRALAERSGGTCELCGQARAVQAHHRRPKGMGGSRRPETHQLAALLHVCVPCHTDAEHERARARRNGWLVAQGVDPATVPVRMWHGLVDLDPGHAA